MATTAFLAKDFATTHERESFANIVGLMRVHWHDSDEPVIIVGNITLGAFSPDAVILKRDAIIVADFKKFSGTITGSESTPWFAGTAEVKGRRAGENPFSQIRDYKVQLKDWMVERFGAPPQYATQRGADGQRIRTYLDHIAGIVVFAGPIKDATTMGEKTQTWFKVVDEDHATLAISHITSRLTHLDETRLFEIAHLLAGTTSPYALPGEPRAAPAGPVDHVYQSPTELPLSIEEKLAHVRHFVASDQQVLLVRGMIGTGLDYLVAALAAWLGAVGKTWALLVPGKRLEGQHDYDARSIYATCFSHHASIVEDVRVYELRDNEDSPEHIYIVCDAHLVSNTMFEPDLLRYGTGHLLQDFVTYAGLDKTRRKIIFVGDPFSLARGKPAESAMSVDFVHALTEIPVETLDLNVLLAEASSDPVVQNCLAFATALEQGAFTDLHILTDDTDKVILAPSFDQLAERITAMFRATPTDVKYLCFKNRTVHQFNLFIRREAFGREGPPAGGDIVEFLRPAEVADKHPFGQPFLVTAGSFAEVVDWTLDEAVVTQGLGKGEPVVVRFSRATLRLLPSRRTVQCLAFQDLILDDQPDIPARQIIALQVAAKVRAKALRVPEPAAADGAATFEGAELVHDPYLNAAQLRFGYALTAHHALGQHFPTVVANCEKMAGRENEDYFRFLYSLFAAASTQIILLDPPEFDILTGATWTVASAQFDETWKPNPDEPIELASAKLRAFYFAVMERLRPAGFRISFIEHHAYQERYHLTSDLGRAKLQIWYNGKGKITTVSPMVYTSVKTVETIRSALKL